MSTTTTGNHSAGYNANRASGVGIINNFVGTGWCSVTASAAGDTTALSLSSVAAGAINQGIYLQSEVPCTVSFTLCNPALIAELDPDVSSAAIWGNEMTTGLDIINPLILCTAIKIIFSAPGTLYICIK